MPSRPFAIALVACLSLAWAAPAHAYIMPAEALARQWADRRAVGWREGSLRITVQAGDRDEGGSDARLYLKRPERMRWQPHDRHVPMVLDVEGRQSHGVGHQIQGEWQRSVHLWLAWLLPRGRRGDDVAPRLLGILKSFGIDPDVVSLARFAGGRIYIIGATPNQQPAPPQLWLDKDTLLPVRTLVDVPAAHLAALREPGPAAAADEAPPPPEERVRLDTRILGWNSGPGGERVPTAWEFWLGEARLQRWEVRQAKTDARLNDALFTWGRPHRP